jgi:hypothetical protein
MSTCELGEELREEGRNENHETTGQTKGNTNLGSDYEYICIYIETWTDTDRRE